VQREVMWWVIDGLKPSEIALLFGKTPEAVRQSLHAARRRLILSLNDRDASMPDLATPPDSPHKEAQ
jgi:RNA polymerase sigma-70 factor (ECF subfamily)